MANKSSGSVIGNYAFDWIHRSTIVFNDAREDPAIDRIALDLQPSDRMVVITSAGCNVLDYLLCNVEHIDSVDLNPLQNALLELKIAGIRKLDFDEFFKTFGEGCNDQILLLYREKLRLELSLQSRKFWDRKINLFSGRGNGGSFYFSGPCGRFSRMINFYIDYCVGLRSEVEAIFACRDLSEQKHIYEHSIREKFWGPLMKWVANRDLTLAMLGVPPAQRRQIEQYYSGGISAFIQSRIANVFTKIPLIDNYHWRIYLFGKYSAECCPEYLKPKNFERLKSGLVDRVSIHTCSVAELLSQQGAAINKFVLLDHLDWLSQGNNPELSKEWQAIVDRSDENAKVIWRSGGLETDFVNQVKIRLNGNTIEMGELLAYDRSLANALHQRDRVQTYGSFYIADIKTIH